MNGLVVVLVSAWFGVSQPEEEPLDLRDFDGNLLPKKDGERDGAGSRSGCPEGMVHIPGGRFSGVDLEGFCLDIDEVTVAKFADYLGAVRHAEEPPMTKGKMRTLKRDLSTASPVATMGASACTWGDHAGSPLRPINCISVVEAAAYCRFYGKRLPSRLEWKWAARNGERGLMYPWGRTGPTPERVLMDAPPSGPSAGPRAVHSFPASALGVFDLGGNVSEWMACEELDAECTTSGGNFRDRGEENFRVAHDRAKVDRKTRGDTIGFRCVSAGARGEGP